MEESQGLNAQRIAQRRNKNSPEALIEVTKMTEWLMETNEGSIDRVHYWCNRLYLRDPKEVLSNA